VFEATVKVSSLSSVKAAIDVEALFSRSILLLRLKSETVMIQGLAGVSRGLLKAPIKQATRKARVISNPIRDLI
jgi:hypothetical protein